LAAAAGLVFAGTAGPVSAQEATLKFPIANTRSAIYTDFYDPWVRKMNAEGAGALKIEVIPGSAVANIFNMYDRVSNDVVQMGFTLFSHIAGKFVLSDVASLPFVADNAEHASVALWRLYKSGALDAEFSDAHPLLLVGLPQSILHMAKPLRSLDDFAGAKLITPTKIVSLAAQQLGGSPMTLPITDMYPAIQRGTADGTILSWNPFKSFKLDEVAFYHVDTGLGTAAGLVFMSRKTYGALPGAARKVIDANSDEAATLAYAKVWDADNDKGRADAKALPNHTIVTLTPQQNGRWRQKVQAALDEWVKGHPDGRKTLTEYRRLVAEVKAGR
jgi:TRAP-type C4-dicarboxylate transport system substrate-binding protein